MPRITKKQQLAKLHDPAAPFLFDDANMPVCNELLEAVRLKRYEHTGDRLLDDDVRTVQLVEMLVNGRGVKRIAQVMHISVHTVRAARTELVRQGKLAPYKERVVAVMEAIVETGLTNYLDALENNEVPPAQIPVGVGIISDKRARELGEPTQITQVLHNQEDLSVERLNSYFDSLPSANPTDTQSTEKP